MADFFMSDLMRLLASSDVSFLLLRPRRRMRGVLFTPVSGRRRAEAKLLPAFRQTFSLVEDSSTLAQSDKVVGGR